MKGIFIMENNMVQIENYTPLLQEVPAEEAGYVSVKKKTTQSYNRSAGALAIHYAIINVVQIIMMIMLPIFMPSVVSKEGFSGFATLLMVSVSYVVAHPLAYIIGLAFTGRLKGSGRLFAKPDIKASTLLLAIPVVFGLQSVSILCQIIFTSVTGSSGVENMDMEMLSFGGDTAMNVLLFIYAVIVGPIGEELLMRGMVLRNSTCTNRTFAIIFTSVLFGLFHGNILQFFVGFLLGLILAYIDVKSGSLLPSVILHVLNNLAAFVMSAAEYYLPGEEQINIMYISYIAVTLVSGIICWIFLRRRLKNKEDIADSPYKPIYDVPAEERKKYGLKLALKSPCVYVFSAIYIISIVINIL